MMALLITSVLVAGVALRSHENDQNAATVRIGCALHAGFSDIKEAELLLCVG